MRKKAIFYTFLLTFSIIGGVYASETTYNCPSGDDTLCVRIEPGNHRVLKGDGPTTGTGTIKHE